MSAIIYRLEKRSFTMKRIASLLLILSVLYSFTLAEAESMETSTIWTCPVCGAENSGKFCPNDAQPSPEPAPAVWICPVCGAENTGNFCPNDATPMTTQSP